MLHLSSDKIKKDHAFKLALEIRSKSHVIKRFGKMETHFIHSQRQIIKQKVVCNEAVPQIIYKLANVVPDQFQESYMDDIEVSISS